MTALARDGYLMCLSVADGQTMQDRTLLFVDVNEFSEHPGSTFRGIPEEVEPIVVNFSLANMDFSDFADNVDAEGVLVGWGPKAVALRLPAVGEVHGRVGDRSSGPASDHFFASGFPVP